MLLLFALVVVIATSIWVFTDARARIDVGGLQKKFETPQTPSTRTVRLATAFATIGATLVLPLASAGSAGIPTISAGGYPWGVAVNPSTNTVYVANMTGNSVSVIDGSTNTVTATVSVGRNPFGVAINPSTNTIYVANAGDNSVSVIDGSTNTVTSTITVGR